MPLQSLGANSGIVVLNPAERIGVLHCAMGCTGICCELMSYLIC